MTPTVLVLGYGSDLRGDDAAGRRVAEAVEARGLPGVETRVLHQLVPELVPELADRRLVVFVDASVVARGVEVRGLDPRPAGPVTTHHLTPEALLAMAARLGCAPAAAAAVSVPAFDLDLGDALSAATADAVAEAGDRVAVLCGAPSPVADPH